MQPISMRNPVTELLLQNMCGDYSKHNVQTWADWQVLVMQSTQYYQGLW